MDSKEVYNEEKDCKAAFKTRQMKDKIKADQEQDDRRNGELRARMDRVVTKVGKTTMPRSIKKRIKKEVVEVKVDEGRVDYVRYLGADIAGSILELNSS